MFQRLDLEAVVAEAIREAVPAIDRDAAVAVARAALARLAGPDIAQELADAVHQAMSSAQDAYALRDDLYENPGNSRVGANVAATAVTQRLTSGPNKDGQEDLDPDAVARRLEQLSYRDWQFRLYHMPDGTLGVAVEAELEDSHHPGRSFRTTRVVPINHGVIESAFRAVMLVEEHEARERFMWNGKRALDPHAIDEYLPPTNRRGHPV